MPALKGKILNNLTEAQKTNDALRVSTLRMLNAAFHNAEIQKRTKLVRNGMSDAKKLEHESMLTDDEMQKVIASEVRKRKESIESFEKGGRKELAQKESKELSILQSYLPAQLSDAELMIMVKDCIAKTGAPSPKDMGRVMKEVMARAGNRAESARVASVIKEQLR